MIDIWSYIYNTIYWSALLDSATDLLRNSIFNTSGTPGSSKLMFETEVFSVAYKIIE